MLVSKNTDTWRLLMLTFRSKFESLNGLQIHNSSERITKLKKNKSV